jgi:ElaB/YqjD/DUF883 family membrane-anchored ribosome-binding protein
VEEKQREGLSKEEAHKAVRQKIVKICQSHEMFKQWTPWVVAIGIAAAAGVGAGVGVGYAVIKAQKDSSSRGKKLTGKKK